MSSTMKLAVVLVGVIAVAGGAFLILGDGGDDGAGGTVVVRDGRGQGSGSYDGADRTAPEETQERIESLATDGPAAGLAAAPARAAPAERDERSEARFTGQVVDEAGRGVAGATVTFIDADQSMLLRFRVSEDDEAPERPETTTDARGRFDLAALFTERDDDDGRPSFLRADDMLVVTHDAFATKALELADLTAGARDVGQIQVGAGAEVYGRIVDENGRPLAEAEVSGTNPVDEGGRGFRAFRIGRGIVDSFNRAVTAADGRFRITGLVPGAAGIEARRDDRQMGFVDDLELLVGVPVDVGDIVLEPGSSIAGTVVDGKGRPVPGVNIRVSSMTRIVANRSEDLPRSTIGHEFRLRATTDADGWFEISGMGHGTYTVHAWGDGFPAVQRENVPTGTRDLRLEIKAYGSVLLTLSSGRDGAPIDGATIDVDDGARGGGFRWGRRAPEDLAPRVVLSGAELAERLDLPLEDVAGQYLIPDVGNEGLDIGVLADGFGAQTVTTPGATSEKIVPFALTLQPESIVRGTVVDARDEPIADALVSMRKAEDGDVFEMGNGEVRREVRRSFRFGDELATETLTARTDRNGVFEVRGASAGTWEVEAEADGWVDSGKVPVTLTDGAEVDDVELELRRGGSIAGTVVDADGIPLSEASVVVSRVEGGGSGGLEAALERELSAMFGGGGDRRRTETDADGEYQIDDLLPGTYRVSLGRMPGGMRMGGAMFVMADGSAPQDDNSIVVDVVADAIVQADLVKPRTATISGEVVAGGRSVEGATVRLGRASPDNPFGRGFRGFGGGRSVETDRFGMYTFEDVEAGDYTVSTIVPGAAMSKEVEVSVQPGGAGRADLLFGGSTLVGRVVDADTGDGVPGVLVTASPNEASGGGPEVMMSFQIVTTGGGPGGSGMSMDLRGGSESTVRTAADGSFEVLYVEPGRYQLRTAEGSHVPGEVGPIEVTDGAEHDDLLIEVARGAALEGRVFSGETGLAMAGVPVRIEGPNGTEMSTTDTEGAYRFEGLVEGGYTAEVLGSGFGSGPIATKDVELKKGETGTLDLTTDPEASSQGGGGITFQVGG